MSSYRVFGFVGTLRESFGILLKSKKFMTYIILLVILLKSLVFLSLAFSSKPYTEELFVTAVSVSLEKRGSYSFTNSLLGLKEYLFILLGFLYVFVLVSFFLSVFSTTAIILLCAITVREKNSTFKDLLLVAGKSWTRPFITILYNTLISTGYFVFSSAILIPLRLIIDLNVAMKALFVVLVILALAFWLYFAVVMILAVVVSVIEENCYGLEALVKAGGFVKGERFDGFVLNLLFMISVLIYIPIFRMIGAEKRSAVRDIIVLASIVYSCLIGMFWIVNYTVLYFKCKKSQGEEIELQGNVEYSKLPTTYISC